MGRKKFSEHTMKKVQWVRRMYNDWRNFRNSHATLQSISCDIDDISTITEKSLMPALCRFITEVKKVDWSDFPSKTLYDIIICMQFWLETQGFSWKLLNDDQFRELRYTADNLMKQHVADGVGISVRKAEVLTFTDEDLLWSLGLLGTHNPEALMNTVVFSLGLSCSLRAGQEHRNLRSIPFQSQFTFLYDQFGKLYFRYTEDIGLKTNKGGIRQRKLEPKSVDVYQIDDVKKCPVRILQKYMSMLPKHRNCKALYLQPKKKFT